VQAGGARLALERDGTSHTGRIPVASAQEPLKIFACGMYSGFSPSMERELMSLQTV
jgi:hypothetical protein